MKKKVGIIILVALCIIVLELSPEDTEIYVYHGEGGYDLALKKDATSGKWERVR